MSFRKGHANDVEEVCRHPMGVAGVAGVGVVAGDVLDGAIPPDIGVRGARVGFVDVAILPALYIDLDGRA